jgi:hypothetical protein
MFSDPVALSKSSMGVLLRTRSAEDMRPETGDILRMHPAQQVLL